MIDPLIVDLTAVRAELDLTQRDVAGAMRTAQSAVSEIERGVCEPRLSTFRRYCAALGYTIELVPLEEVADAS